MKKLLLNYGYESINISLLDAKNKNVAYITGLKVLDIIDTFLKEKYGDNFDAFSEEYKFFERADDDIIDLLNTKYKDYDEATKAFLKKEYLFRKTMPFAPLLQFENGKCPIKEDGTDFDDETDTIETIVDQKYKMDKQRAREIRGLKTDGLKNIFNMDLSYYNMMVFFYILAKSPELHMMKRDNGNYLTYVFSFKGKHGEFDDQLSFLEIGFRKHNVENFGRAIIKFYGRMELLNKYLMERAVIKYNYWELSKKLMLCLEAKHLGRIDYFFDYNGVIKDDFEHLKFLKKKRTIYGNITSKEGGKIDEIELLESYSLYWGKNKRSEFEIKSYNKYDDSLKKGKLYLYNYIMQFTRRLEFSIKKEYWYKKTLENKNKSIIKIDNKNIYEMLQLVYDNVRARKDQRGNPRYQVHFDFPEVMEGESKMEYIEASRKKKALMIKKMKEKTKEQRLKEENGNPLLKSEEIK